MKKSSILITGAGGPAAICTYKALVKEGFNLHMADMDKYSAGLYLVPDDKRHIIPGGESDTFIDRLLKICSKNKIDVLIPTVDCELFSISSSLDQFREIETEVVINEQEVLEKILNKYTLLQTLSKEGIDVGQFDLLQKANPDNWKYKRVVIKPVTGSGSRGVEFYDNFSQIPTDRFRNKNIMIQEFIDGPEYSVDTMTSLDGVVKAAIPRIRLRIDSGVSMTGMVIKNKAVIKYAKEVINALGIAYVANIQIIDCPNLGSRIVEINPRFSGGLSLVVHSGANTPLMSVQEVLGREVVSVTDFKEVAMVRHFQETFVPSKDLMVLA